MFGGGTPGFGFGTPQQGQQQQQQTTTPFGGGFTATPQQPKFGAGWGTPQQQQSQSPGFGFGTQAQQTPSTFGTPGFGGGLGGGVPFGGAPGTTGLGLGGMGMGMGMGGLAGQQQLPQQPSLSLYGGQQQPGLSLQVFNQAQQAQTMVSPETDFKILRDYYTPENAPQGLLAAQNQQRMYPYRFKYKVRQLQVPRDFGGVEIVPQVVEIELQSLDDVLRHVQMQQQTMQRTAQQIKEFREKVNGIEKQGQEAQANLNRHRDKLTDLMQKFLHLLEKIQVMESLCKPLTAREQEVRDSLEQIIARLTQSISRLQEAQPHMRWQDIRSAEKPSVLSEEETQAIHLALQKQQEGLSTLCRVVQRDRSGLALLKERLDQDQAW